MPFVMPPTGNAKGSAEGPVCATFGGWAPSKGGLNWLPGCEWWYAWSNFDCSILQNGGSVLFQSFYLKKFLKTKHLRIKQL